MPGRLDQLDAVTFDLYGTLVGLADPVPAIDAALRARNVEAGRREIAQAFAIESEYFRANTVRGRDEASLAELHADSAGVFLSALGEELDPAEFAPAYANAMRFELLDGAIEELGRLKGRGVPLGVVANWDIGLHDWLERLGLAPFFDAVVSAAEAGAAKPDPRIFAEALTRLGARPERTLHVGDDEVDEQGAAAAGMQFARAPLASALEGWR